MSPGAAQAFAAKPPNRPLIIRTERAGITSPMHPLGLGRLASPGTSPTGSDSLAALPCRPTLGLTTVPVSAHETPRYDRVGGSLLYFLGQFVIPFCISAYQMCISYVSAVYQCFRTFAFLIRLYQCVSGMCFICISSVSVTWVPPTLIRCIRVYQ